MKKILVLFLILLFANKSWANHKIVYGIDRNQKIEVTCGETDSVIVLMSTSPIYLSAVQVSIKNSPRLLAYGFFWQTEKYALLTNGDMSVAVVKFNILYVIVPLFVLFLLGFIVFYFSNEYSSWKQTSIMFIACLFLGSSSVATSIILWGNSLAVSGVIFGGIPVGILAWIIVWSCSKLVKINRPVKKFEGGFTLY